MDKSREFNREGEADPKDVVKKAGPLGILPILYLSTALLIIIAVLLWWAAS